MKVNRLRRGVLAGTAAFALLAGTLSGGTAQTGKNLAVIPTKGPLAGQQIYDNSHALLIGVNEYPKLPKNKWLNYAINDVTALREMLIKYYGFPARNVTVLTDKDATSANILRALAGFGDSRKIGTDDRLFIYFSGHGQTVKMPTGGQIGFLLPYDADVDLDNVDNAGPYMATCLKMSTVWEMIDASPAKHALMMADACYSGLLAAARGGGEKISDALLARLASKRARQVITAGGQGEQSFEDPKLGHGAFTYKLLEELKARASTPGDAFMAQDLYNDLVRSVGNLTGAKQNPQMAAYQTEGQFLFITTDGKPVEPIAVKPPERPTEPAGGTESAPSEKELNPAGKLRVMLSDVDVQYSSSARFPPNFKENLTSLLSFNLASAVDLSKVSVLERKNLELLNQERSLTRSVREGAIPGSDVVLNVVVRDVKQVNVGSDVVQKVGGALGGLLGRKGPKVTAGLSLVNAIVEVKMIDSRDGALINQFSVTGKSAESKLDVGFGELFNTFQFDGQTFQKNPVGVAVRNALEQVVKQVTAELAKRKA